MLGFFLLKAYQEMNEVIGIASISPEIGERLNTDDAKKVFLIIIACLVGEVFILGALGLRGIRGRALHLIGLGDEEDDALPAEASA